MEDTTPLQWPQPLSDPAGMRQGKPRDNGKTMVIDKGLGLHALQDLLQTAGEHMDYLKIGFGTAPLYPPQLLRRKIETAKSHSLIVYPGGTFLEAAIAQNAVDDYFRMIAALGFNGLEISDGTIELSRNVRSELIVRAGEEGFVVITEYGKKGWGSAIELNELIETVTIDSELGAQLVTIEGRESGKGVGIFDENGDCKDEEIEQVLSKVPSRDLLMWEAPQREQQVHLLRMLGPNIHIGNVAASDVISLEALRRGLRSDTFDLGPAAGTARKEQNLGGLSTPTM